MGTRGMVDEGMVEQVRQKLGIARIYGGWDREAMVG